MCRTSKILIDMGAIIEKYIKVITDWQQQIVDSNLSKELLKILGRGLWMCGNNPKNGIIISGINPSFDKKIPREYNDTIPFALCSGRYWNPLKKFVGEFLKTGNVGYIDLFPLRVSKQDHEFEKYVPTDLKAAILRVTQNEIEQLAPKLIIYANSTSRYYWGTDTEHPWMGYQLTQMPLPSSLQGKGVLYHIDGMLNSDQKILPLKDTALKGSYLFVCPFQSGGRCRIPSERKLVEEDIKQLWEIANNK